MNLDMPRKSARVRVDAGDLQHDIPSVRLHFRDDDDRLDGPAQDHQENVGKFVASADVFSSPIPAGTNYKLAQRALAFQRSHVRNLWHSMGEDSADLYVRMCRWATFSCVHIRSLLRVQACTV
jgi:hypothetical protein